MVDEDELAQILGSGKIIEIGKKKNIDDVINKDVTINKNLEIKYIKPEGIYTYNDEVGLDPNVRSDPLIFLTFITIFTTLEKRPNTSPIQTNNIAQIKIALERTEFEELKAVWKTFDLEKVPPIMMLLQGLTLLLENIEAQDYSKLKDSFKKKLEKPDFSFSGSFKIWNFKEVPPSVFNGCLMLLNHAKTWKNLSSTEQKLINSYLEMVLKYDFNRLKNELNKEYSVQKERFIKSNILKIEESMIETAMCVGLLFKILNM